MNKPQWTVELGEAKIISKPDGGLMVVDDHEKHPHVIIEVKAGILMSNDGASTFRQMGIEFLCWRYRCHQDNQRKSR